MSEPYNQPKMNFTYYDAAASPGDTARFSQATFDTVAFARDTEESIIYHERR